MAINRAAESLGVDGEEIATRFLIENGFRILDRNWRIRRGELDIVALSSDGEIVICEVKTRRSSAFGDPIESITPKKSLRLHHLALAWLATHERLGSPYRVDVIAILITHRGAFHLEHYIGVL